MRASIALCLGNVLRSLSLLAAAAAAPAASAEEVLDARNLGDRGVVFEANANRHAIRAGAGLADIGGGRLVISDAIFLLLHLFQQGAVPPAPGPAACGFDPSADRLEACARECR